MNPQLTHYEDKLNYEMDSADLFDALGRGDPVVIIDARRTDAYAHEHIPGAVNFPHGTMNAASTAGLDRTKTYIAYCDGIGCNASTRGARNLAALGFTVRELIGGLDWWKRDGYATEGTGAQTGTGIRCAC